MINIIFTYLCIVHVLIYGVVVFSFLNIELAKINLFYLIPFIYIIHVLPFHILVTSKKMLYKENYSNKQNEFDNISFTIYFIKLQNILNNYCTFSPISPQGMLIFGALSSAFTIFREVCIISKDNI